MSKAKHDFVAELALVKNRAGQLGMWRTMHALDEATQEAGWELAEAMDPKSQDRHKRYKVAQRKAEEAARG